MQLYYFTKAEYALTNIEKRRVKVSRFESLNDPFEWLSPACRNHYDMEFLRYMRKTMDATNGLICMSEDWTNPVQWGHYAENHRGICLGFEVDTAVASPVKYFSAREVFDDLSFLIDDQKAAEAWMQDQIILRKFDHWRYEREWRIHVNLVDAIKEGDLYYEPFGDQVKLNKVLLGARCDVHRTTIQRVLMNLSGVAIIRAMLAPHKYAVCDERYVHQWD